MPGPTDRSKRDQKTAAALRARIKELEANAAASAADRTDALTSTRPQAAERAAEERAKRPPATVAQGDKEPFVEEMENDAAAKRRGDTYARLVEEDDAAASLEADTKALEKKRPVAVQKTLDRDSIDYPGDKPAAARVKAGSGEGGFVFGGPQYGAEAVRASAGPQAAVAGNTRMDWDAYAGPDFDTSTHGPAAGNAASLEARLATARERLKAARASGPTAGGRVGR